MLIHAYELRTMLLVLADHTNAGQFFKVSVCEFVFLLEP